MCKLASNIGSRRSFAGVVLLVIGNLGAAGCGDDDESPGLAASAALGAEEDFEELDPSVCDPQSGSFTLPINNTFLPLPIGRRLILTGQDEGGVSLRVEVTVLKAAEEVAGVTTRVVEEAEYEDGELVELSRNFIVQAAERTVCYFGEEVDQFEEGDLVGHEGSWRAGEDGALPGILMPGSPQEGTRFSQERAPPTAEDQGAVIALDETISVDAGTFENVIHILEWNPLEGETIEEAESKFYAQGIGLIVDDLVQLSVIEVSR